MQKPFYITTTLPYVNDDPHVGFAMEIIQADTIARAKRLRGIDVFFNTGTDEHGQKIFQKANKEQVNVVEYVDKYAAEFRKLKSLLNLSNDRFIRTTDPDHVVAAQELWKRCLAKGDIYKKKYKGLYCVSDEMYLKEGDLVNGRCPNHQTIDPIEIEEENYFFRLSAYQDKLLTYLKQDGVILPEWRQQEAIKFVESGLEDFSISREKARMEWGVPVPDDDDQVMYVWFDALTNYISTLGWPTEEGNFNTFWKNGDVVQCAGKDQVRFQSIMWQAMLMSAEIKNTDTVFYHGFINSGGQKMSKSIGNVLNPYDIVDMFKPVAGNLATDVLRYYLLRHMNTFDDSDVTIETIKEAYQGNLANGLGNLTSRILTLSERHLEGCPEIPEKSIPQEFFDLIDAFNIQGAMEYVWKEVQTLDRYIQETEAFKVIKTDEAKGKALITEYVLRLYAIARMLNPLMPATNELLKKLIKENKKPEAPLFARLS
jgi:methionyl-tRNA synthetase